MCQKPHTDPFKTFDKTRSFNPAVQKCHPVRHCDIKKNISGFKRYREFIEGKQCQVNAVQLPDQTFNYVDRIHELTAVSERITGIHTPNSFA